MTLVRKKFFPTASSLFDNFLTDELFSNKLATKYTLPAVNIKEVADAFQLEVAAPGLKKEDFKIELNHNILTVSSESKQEKQETEEKEEGKYSRKEFFYSSFTRTFTLPESIDSEKISASYTDGILHISIPKKEEAKQKAPRTINIQ